MEQFWTQLEQFIQGRPLCRRIILTPSRSMGRQLLIQCARRGQTVVGVEVQSIFTLAMELCSSTMAGADGFRFLSRLETEELVARLLQESELVQQYPELGTVGGSKAVWRLLEELELYRIAMDKREGQNLWNGLAVFQQRFHQELKSRRLLTRPALYRLALQTVEQSAFQPPAQEYAVLSSVQLKPLERQLWQTLTGSAVVELTMENLDGPVLAEHLQGRCRFVRCRGRENEIRFLIDEVLRESKSLDTVAVAVTRPEYALRLWREGQRLGIPVAVDGGIPLRSSTLYGLLEGLYDWYESDYEVELLIPLLVRTGLEVPHPTMLQKELRRCKVCWKKPRYALVWKEREEDTGEVRTYRRQWKNFFDRLFRAVEVSPNQKKALGELLRDGCKVQSTESGAASWQLRSILEQLKPREGLSLVKHLLQAVGDSRYLRGVPAPGVLFCSSLEQCVAAGAEKLYVLGLEQYSLESSNIVSQLLGREERASLGLPEREASSPLEQLQRLLSLWEGEIVLTRPSFTVAEMQDQPAAPFYEELLGLCGGKKLEECVGFALPADNQTAGGGEVPAADRPGAQLVIQLEAVPTKSKTESERFPDGKAWVEQFTFSATSLEMALQCPYRFYLQNVLKIYQPQEILPPENRWLEPGPFGTLVHDVLEQYFQAQKDGHPADAEDLLMQYVEQMKEIEPPAPPLWVKRDIARARQYIQRAIDQFDASRTVVGTEYAFGKGTQGGEMEIIVEKYRIHIEGRIDRVDQLAPNTYAIVDYKTGQSRKYREHPQRYLQPLLYTLAAEKLLGEGAHVQEAGYLFLQDTKDAQYIIPQTPQVREDGLKKLGALLDQLCQFDHEPERNPCFEWDGHNLKLGEEEARRDHRECGKYCPYRQLCEQ